MFGFFFTSGPVNCFEDATKADMAKFGRWHRGMLERGVYLAPSAYEVWGRAASRTFLQVLMHTQRNAHNLSDEFVLFDSRCSMTCFPLKCSSFPRQVVEMKPNLALPPCRLASHRSHTQMRMSSTPSRLPGKSLQSSKCPFARRPGHLFIA